MFAGIGLVCSGLSCPITSPGSWSLLTNTGINRLSDCQVCIDRDCKPSHLQYLFITRSTRLQGLFITRVLSMSTCLSILFEYWTVRRPGDKTRFMCRLAHFSYRSENSGNLETKLPYRAKALSDVDLA